MKILSVIAIVLLIVSCGNEDSSKKFEGNWIEVMPVSLDVVQGVTLGAEGVARSIGMAT